jgi:hypothetical protein
MMKHNVSAIRRVRKSDNNRIALAIGATIVNRVEDLRESDVGTQCGLFNIEKIGDELFFSRFVSILGLTRRQVFYVPNGMQNPKGLYHRPPGPIERHSQRD